MPSRRNTAILFFVTLIVTGVLSYHEIGCDDHWWHVATGRLMRAEMRIPPVDVFSFTYEGAPWHNNEWGFSLFISLVWDHAGTVGFFLYRWLVLFGIALFLVGAVAERRKETGAGPPSLAFSLSLVAFILLVLQIRIGIRPHLLGYLFLSALVWRLQRPLLWKDRRSLLVQAAVFFAVWAFFHYSWTLGVVVALAAIGDRYLQWRWGDAAGFLRETHVFVREHRAKTAVAFLLLVVCGVMLAASGPLSFILSHLSGVEDIYEWQSYWSWLSVHPFFALTALYFVAFVLSAFAAFRRAPLYCLMMIAVAALSLRSIRFQSEFLIISLPVVIAMMASFFVSRPDRTVRPLTAAVFCLMLWVALAGNTLLLGREWGMGVSTVQNPVLVADFMDERRLSGNLYATNTSYHAYFMFRSWPQVKVFFDGRHRQVYPSEFIRDVFSLSFADTVARYPVEYVVKYIAITGLERPEDDLLHARPSGYELAYFDQHWALFMRADVFARYPSLKPFRMLYPAQIAQERIMRQVVEMGNLPVLREELAYYRTLVRQPEQQQLYDLMRAEIAKYGPVD